MDEELDLEKTSSSAPLHPARTSAKREGPFTSRFESMELRIPVAELSRALALAQGVVQRKNTMPILSHVLLDAGARDGGRLTLSATDLDVGVRTERACEVTAPGAVTIPARALADMVRELPGPDVTLKR